MTEEVKSTNPQMDAILKEMAERELKAREARAMEQRNEIEYNEALEKALREPTLAAHGDRFREFAGASSLKRYGKDGLIDVIALFNERLKLEEAQKATAAKTTIPGGSADPGKPAGSASGDQQQYSIPRLPNGGFDWLAVDINTVDPAHRTEVLRKQAVQRSRQQKSAYGW